jgi:hypothetical protein
MFDNVGIACCGSIAILAVLLVVLLYSLCKISGDIAEYEERERGIIE